jgi:2,5-furandicarboxylate decarboxylase 1
MAKDLHSFLEFLEDSYPDQVFRVKREVDPVFEVTAILAKLEKEGRFPVVVFENVKGSDIPVVTNMHADFRRCAMSIGLPPEAKMEDFIAEYSKREQNPIEPVMVPTGPVKEVILKGEDVDLYKLPILKYHEQDAGRYITLGYSIMKDPDNGIRNAGVYRFMIKGKNKMGVQISETAHGHYILKKHQKRGVPLN